MSDEYFTFGVLGICLIYAFVKCFFKWQQEKTRRKVVESYNLKILKQQKTEIEKEDG